MPIRITFGRRVFTPSWGFTVLTLALCAAFFHLGRWQWHKGDLRQAEWTRFAQGSDRVVALGAAPLASVPRFQRVSLEGHFDGDHQFLLDNRSYQGQAGFEVLTPLRRPNGSTVVVDRGWVPFSGRRTQLPDVLLGESSAAVHVTGRAADLPSPGLASGRAPPAGSAWPKVTSFPSMSQLSTALGSTLEPRLVLLDPQDSNGYVRDWHPPGMEPIRHWSYAVQWWAFAVVLLGLWLGLNIHKLATAS